jgi:hypothetical protein
MIDGISPSEIAVFIFVQGGDFFHPSDVDLSPGAPEKIATRRFRFRHTAEGEML